VAESSQKPAIKLNTAQQKAVQNIISDDRPTLLFGVTGSGKTEVYQEAIQHYLDLNEQNQALFLIPEINLNQQLIRRFQARFGNQIAVWNSKLSMGEKVQSLALILSGKARIIMGTRSAVLLPIPKPSIIILDEEHDHSYKNEFLPRFWTHDIVQGINKIFPGKLIFGSATPKVESWQKAQEKIWQKVELPERIFQTIPPEMNLIDMLQEHKKENFSPFSERLSAAIEDSLENKRQVILFLNKRGMAGNTQCSSCGHGFECPMCDSFMKMHEKNFHRKFICHICGHLENFPEKCPKCTKQNFLLRSWGTQKVEQLLQEKFPQARIIRADADTVRGKNDFSEILHKFENHQADILLGTQMIAKGLDFDKVDVVGILNGDVGLVIPDFRSEERVFQILHQVSGRAGRRKIRGKIYLQTYRAFDPIFTFVYKHQVQEFLEQELKNRADYWSPWRTTAKIIFSSPQKHLSFFAGQGYFRTLKKILENKKDWRINFAPAFVPRTHGQYHFNVFIHGTNKQELINFLHQNPPPPELTRIDINPLSVL